MAGVHTTRQTLLERLKSPSADRAWEDFYELYWGVIVRYAQKQGLNEASAFDVLQETMVALIRMLPTFSYDPRKGKFRNFLLTIVHRKSKRAIHRASRRREVSFDAVDNQDDRPLIERTADSSAPVPSEAMENQWRESIQEEALRRVRDDPRVQKRTFEVFIAYAVEGLPAGEIADKFGIKENAVYQIKDRMIKRLQQEIDLLKREAE